MIRCGGDDGDGGVFLKVMGDGGFGGERHCKTSVLFSLLYLITFLGLGMRTCRECSELKSSRTARRYSHIDSI